MAIIKADHVLQEVQLTFDDLGNVKDVTLVVSYALKDDVTGTVETAVGKAKTVWDALTVGEKASLNAVGKRLKTLAEGF